MGCAESSASAWGVGKEPWKSVCQPPPDSWQQTGTGSACPLQPRVLATRPWQPCPRLTRQRIGLPLGGCPRGTPSSGPLGYHPRGTEGPERGQKGVSRAPGRRRLVTVFLDESPGPRQRRARTRPAANLSAVGLSQHAIWKVKVFNVNFVLPTLSSGIHRCSVSRHFLSRSLGLKSEVTWCLCQNKSAPWPTILWERAGPGWRWLPGLPWCRVLSGPIFGRAFFLSLLFITSLSGK